MTGDRGKPYLRDSDSDCGIVNNIICHELPRTSFLKCSPRNHFTPGLGRWSELMCSLLCPGTRERSAGMLCPTTEIQTMVSSQALISTGTSWCGWWEAELPVHLVNLKFRFWQFHRTYELRTNLTATQKAISTFP